jgi:hypothetical protein
VTPPDRPGPDRATPRLPQAVGQGVTPTRRSACSAAEPILASKITAPQMPEWAIPRPRITQLIGCGMRLRPLTVVTGPPGAGKTMALALWAATEPGPVAWVALDEYDNQPGVFWSYLIAALRRAGVAVTMAWPASAPAQKAPVPVRAAAGGGTGGPGSAGDPGPG